MIKVGEMIVESAEVDYAIKYLDPRIGKTVTLVFETYAEAQMYEAVYNSDMPGARIFNRTILVGEWTEVE